MTKFVELVITAIFVVLIVTMFISISSKYKRDQVVKHDLDVMEKIYK